MQDVKIEDGKLKVSKSGGVEKEFDIPMPTVTPTELTDNGDGTGSVKYGDKTLPVMTKPTTATKAEDGAVTITNSNGTEVTLTIPDCPDTLLVDAFGKVEVGYIHSTTCDKSEVEPEEKKTICVQVSREYEDNSGPASSLDASPGIKPTVVMFKLRDLPIGVAGIDKPLTVRFTSVGIEEGVEIFHDVYTATIPAGSSTATVPYKTYPDEKFNSSPYIRNTLEVVSYEGKYTVEPYEVETPVRSIDRL